jgi:hypothetical protein
MSFLKTAGRYTLWGVGIYLGLCVAGELAKPLSKEVTRGYEKMRSKLKKGAGRESAAEPSAAKTARTAPAAKKTAARKKRAPAANKSTKPSSSWSKSALYARAKELGISGRSAMSKNELLAAIRTKATA